MENRQRIILPLALLIAILAVSTASIFIRFAQREAPSLVIAAFRLFFASLVLLPFAFTRYRDELMKLSRSELILGLLSGIFLALHFATWISSLEYTTVASSVVLVSTSPLWVALLAPIFLKETPSRHAAIGIFLALIGGTIIGLSDVCSLKGGLNCPPVNEFFKGNASLGNFLALMGAWTVTGYLMIGRKLRSKISLVPYIFLVYSISAVVLIIIMVLANQSPFGYSPTTYLWILLLALVPQLIGHSTYNWALRFLPAAFIAVTTLGEPIGSTILAFVILMEIPTYLQIIGGLFILTGIVLASKSSNQK